MTVKELIEKLKGYDQNTEVMTKKVEIFGNIGEVHSVRNDSYAFFGRTLPCVLLSDEFEDSEDMED